MIQPKIAHYSNGQKQYETWLVYNKPSRMDGPAIIRWYENGQKHREVWFFNGKHHRDNGPARIEWYENGNLFSYEWLIDGKHHRIGAPSFIVYNNDDTKTISSCGWYLHGEHYYLNEYINKCLDENYMTKSEAMLLKLKWR